MDLLKKLKLDIDKPVWLINAPENMADLLPGVTIKEKLGKAKPVEQLMLFALDSETLNHYMQALADYIAPSTLLWICYPKKTGSIGSDLTQMKTWENVFAMGYRGQTSIAIDDTWTGMRFTNAPPAKKAVAPIEERQTEGIDYVNRTVELPKDALAVLKRYKGTTTFFKSMAFTHQKEYMEAIANAKKEETRKRRIDKMAEMLQQKMLEAAAKKKRKA